MLFLLLISALISLCTSAPRPNASVWTNWSNRVESVGNEKDIVLRNFQITAGYYGLSLDFAALLQASADSGDSFALNWPTLAAWASNSVGVSIRKEIPTGWVRKALSFLPKALQDLLLAFPVAIGELFQGLLTKTAVSLAGGNAAVWIEVGSAFANFGIHYGNLTGPDVDRNARFNATFCSDVVCTELKNAMQWYYRGLFEPSPKLRQEYFCAANAQVGQAEQTRLQPYIAGALVSNYTFTIFGQTFTFPTEALVTHFMITLMFPDEWLVASQDVPLLNGVMFPPPVATLTNPEVLSTYLFFYNRSNSLTGTGASDWYSLGQRLRFVVPLFRRSQQDTKLVTCPPFTPDQFTMIWKGIKPKSSDLCLDIDCCRQPQAHHHHPISTTTSGKVSIVN